MVGKSERAASELPQFTHPFFWEYDPLTLSLDTDWHLIIRRLLLEGDDRSLRWLRLTVGDDNLAEWIIECDARGFPAKDVCYWCLILKIPRRLEKRWVTRAVKKQWNGEGN